MNEPKRWLEQGAPRDVEHLVRAAQAEQPSEISLGRTLTALGVGLATTSVAPGASAAGTAANAGTAAPVAGAGASAKATLALTGGMIAKWTALGATVATLASVGSYALRGAEQAPAASIAAPARPDAGSVPRASAYSKQTTLAPGSSVGVAEVAKTPPAARAAPVAAAASSLPLDTETLAEEVRSVDRARAALAAGRAAQTLAVLDDYERRFPKRGFAPEALYLRMEALLALGRAAQARAIAERLLASYPNSLHRARARAVLSKNP
jgi:hypothetical protein